MASHTRGGGERREYHDWGRTSVLGGRRVSGQRALAPGEVALLRVLAPGEGPTVVASASRVTDVRTGPGEIAFRSQGPAATTAATRIALPGSPKSTTITSTNGAAHPFIGEWDATSETLLLSYENLPDGVAVRVAY